jgi:outer membrane protein OmpA-like peptidoglycan-associated protein
MPKGILNKNIYVDGVWKTTEEIRNSLLGRNLPPPVTDTVIESGLQGFQEEMGNLIFGLPNQAENIPLDKDKIKNDEIEDRNDLLNHNKYFDIDDVYEYTVFPPNIEVSNIHGGDYTTQNFGLIGLSSSIGIQNPFTAIDSPRTSNFDTQLGNFASERLEFLLNERVSQAVINETVERVNTNPLNILQGNELVQRNYDITVPTTIVGKGVELINRFTGTEIPISTIPNGAIGWQEYNTAKANWGKIKTAVNKLLVKLGVSSEIGLPTEGRMKELLKRTGSGQKNSLFSHLDLNGYSPDYSSPRLFGLLPDRSTNSRYYIGNSESTNVTYGMTQIFTSEDFNNQEENVEVRPPENFVWEPNSETIFPEQTILAKTNYIADQFSESDVFINLTKKFFKEKRDGQYTNISRGNAIKNDSGDYARVWLKSSDGSEREQLQKGYSYQNAIRKSGLFTKSDSKPGFSVDSSKSSLSVLQSNGMVKHYPYLEESKTTFKKYMLSIENLAWSDNLTDLPLQEIGPGDLINGRKGRIMWFAPYDLSFDETISANWTETNFIGRGEPLYTYNNTKRSGQFKFKILVDHPRVINEYRGKQDNELEKFFAGIKTPQQLLDLIATSNDIDEATKKEIEKELNKNERKVNSVTTSQEEFNIYFENNSTTLPPTTYETDLNSTYIDTVDNGVTSKIGEFLSKTGGTYNVTINGYASASGDFADNQILSAQRILSAKSFLKEFNKDILFETVPFGESEAVASDGVDKDNEQAVIDRRVEISISYEESGDVSEEDKEELAKLEKIKNDKNLIKNLFINEATYFDIIDEDYPNYYDSISPKIKYFHPGFHSNTPEGLNTRLTFLQQCMRQGNSVYSDKDSRKADNLAFGRPPVLILRMGDFLYTKIVANSLSINYEEGGIQWDLNPEGIGVQPMIANVSMSIEIIGGQSLQGPINRLQNAMSYNFYANTEMYDVRADSIELNGTEGRIVDGKKISNITSDEYKNSLNGNIKNEIPINQLGSKDNTESAEGETTTSGGTIDINVGGTIQDQTFIVYTETGEVKIVITNNNDDSNVFDDQNSNTTNTYNLSDIDSTRWNMGDSIFALQEVINNLDTEIAAETKDRKIKKLNREKDKKVEEIESLIEENIIKFNIKANFVDNESIMSTKDFTYKWVKGPKEVSTTLGVETYDYYWEEQ